MMSESLMVRAVGGKLLQSSILVLDRKERNRTTHTLPKRGLHNLVLTEKTISTEGLFAMEADHRSLLVISHWKAGVESCQIVFTVFEGELPACLITLLNRKLSGPLPLLLQMDTRRT
ncbi:uncharacterized protein LOC121600033 isoform X2 [Anopheles merus]|uniref:uncharacterized protein LOC121600033 isoform X2 n=2 Tax=Anopheles merus TaxID=30066 RepID=UPI001BE4DD7D|nr:uncharacterized protein LOC121600033 isoform X2 [Anopheles merus]